jgi:hypothetical protein
VLPLGFIECCLRLGDRLLTTLLLLLPPARYFPMFAFAPPLGPFVLLSGLSGRLSSILPGGCFSGNSGAVDEGGPRSLGFEQQPVPSGRGQGNTIPK